MSKKDYLQQALQHIGSFGGVPVSEDNVLVHGPSADGREYTVVLDMGIKGSPKYRIPIKELPKLIEPAPLVEQGSFYSWNEPEPAEDVDGESYHEYQSPIADPEPAVDDLESKSYRELQELAKEYGIPANQNAETLILAIQEQEDVG